jgi:hypothetical protein
MKNKKIDLNELAYQVQKSRSEIMKLAGERWNLLSEADKEILRSLSKSWNS